MHITNMNSLIKKLTQSVNLQTIPKNKNNTDTIKQNIVIIYILIHGES